MAKLARYFVKSKGCGLNSEHHAIAFAHKILFSPRADNSLTLSHNNSTTSVRFDISRCPSFMASAIAWMGRFDGDSSIWLLCYSMRSMWKTRSLSYDSNEAVNRTVENLAFMRNSCPARTNFFARNAPSP